MPNTLPPVHILNAATRLWSQAGQAHWVTVQGQSMHPLLRPGDEVWVTPSPAALRRGDLVVLRTPTGLLVHRLLRADPWIQPHRLWTQGDANRRPDPPASGEDLLGQVLAVRRLGGKLDLAAPQRRVYGWLVASAMLVVNRLEAGPGPWRALGHLAAAASWRLLRVFCLLAGR